MRILYDLPTSKELKCACLEIIISVARIQGIFHLISPPREFLVEIASAEDVRSTAESDIHNYNVVI